MTIERFVVQEMIEGTGPQGHSKLTLNNVYFPYNKKKKNEKYVNKNCSFKDIKVNMKVRLTSKNNDSLPQQSCMKIPRFGIT